MPRILIAGAGQAGLHLALALQGYGYDVTVMTDRDPEDVRNGRILSTNAMFAGGLTHERNAGLDRWQDQAQRIEGVGISVAGPDAARVIDWVGRLDDPGQNVDQRVKMPQWLETFAARGGRVIVRAADAAEIDRASARYDLVLVATGRGGIASLFERDTRRSPYETPQRALAVAYVHGLATRPEHDFEAVRANLIPGAGELFVMPCLTTSGPCDLLFFEGIPGGPLDVFGEVDDPGEHLRRTLDLMRAFTPWEYERAAQGVELTDALAVLSGRFTPTVRHPVAELPGGGLALGVADVVVTNDPITGQGSSSAAKCAAIYLRAILEHGVRPFDRSFMEATFDRYWQVAKHVTRWTNAMLAPPPEHVLQLIAAAETTPQVANRFANAFSNPADLDDWFFEPGAAHAYLTSVTQA